MASDKTRKWVDAAGMRFTRTDLDNVRDVLGRFEKQAKKVHGQPAISSNA